MTDRTATPSQLAPRHLPRTGQPTAEQQAEAIDRSGHTRLKPRSAKAPLAQHMRKTVNPHLESSSDDKAIDRSSSSDGLTGSQAELTPSSLRKRLRADRFAELAARSRKAIDARLSRADVFRRIGHLARLSALPSVLPLSALNGNTLGLQGYGFPAHPDAFIDELLQDAEALKSLRCARKLRGSASFALAHYLLSLSLDSHTQTFSLLAADVWERMGSKVDGPLLPLTFRALGSDDEAVSLRTTEILCFFASPDAHTSPLLNHPAMRHSLLFAHIRREPGKRFHVGVSGVFPYFHEGDKEEMRGEMPREAGQRLTWAIEEKLRGPGERSMGVEVHLAPRTRIAALEGCGRGDGGLASLATLSGTILGTGPGARERRQAFSSWIAHNAPLTAYEGWERGARVEYEMGDCPHAPGQLAALRLAKQLPGPADDEPLLPGLPRPSHLKPAPRTRFHYHMEGIALAAYGCIVEFLRFRILGNGNIDATDAKEHGCPRTYYVHAPLSSGFNPPPWDSDMPLPLSLSYELTHWHLTLRRRYFHRMKPWHPDVGDELRKAEGKVLDEMAELRATIHDADSSNAAIAGARTKLGDWSTSREWALERVHKLQRRDVGPGRFVDLSDWPLEIEPTDVEHIFTKGTASLDVKSLDWLEALLPLQPTTPLCDAAVQACLVLDALELKTSSGGDLVLSLPDDVRQKLSVPVRGE